MYRATAAIQSAGIEVSSDRPTGGLVVFDLDRTLVAGSSLVPLGRALIRERMVSPYRLARHGIEAIAYQRRGERAGAAARLKQNLLEMAAGRAYEPLAALAADVGRRLVADMHPTARWLVDRHLEAGDFCVIASASVHELVEGVATALGVHRGVGTRVAVDQGRLTGALLGPLCHGADKLVRLRSELGEVDLGGAAAYADSGTDLPVLSAVGSAVAVNPDRTLRREAALRSWPVIDFG